MWWLVAIAALGVAAMAGKKAVQTTPLNVSDAIKAVGEAIARAEGFYVAGSLPARANNPGNLKIGDRGNGVIDGKTIFATPQDGWNALYRQLDLVRTGKSRNFKVTDTWREFARTWVGTLDADNWAANVTKRLGATPLDSVGRYLA
jgi:hypothetical protein